MRNLAGHPDSNALWINELVEAGLRPVPSAEPDGETRVLADGLVDLGGGFTLRVVRQWVYASAKITPALPIDAAVEVNESPYLDASGTKYSGRTPTLGALARAQGYAGGMSAEHLRRYSRGSVEHWHCDTIPALSALVEALRCSIALRGLVAAEALEDFKRAHTESWMAECGPMLDGESDEMIAKIMRRALHTDTMLNETDPRVVRLRAKYPPETAG